MRYRVQIDIEIDSPLPSGETLDVFGEAIVNNNKDIKVTRLVRVEIEELEYKDVKLEKIWDA